MSYFNENGKNVAVIGSRTFQDKERLYKYLDKNKSSIKVIVSGGASGADSLAAEWAEERSVPYLILPAKWKHEDGTRNLGGGFQRNIEIIKKSQVVIAFWDQISRGTANSIELAKKYGKKLIILTFDPKKEEAKIEPKENLEIPIMEVDNKDQLVISSDPYVNTLRKSLPENEHQKFGVAIKVEEKHVIKPDLSVKPPNYIYLTEGGASSEAKEKNDFYEKKEEELAFQEVLDKAPQKGLPIPKIPELTPNWDNEYTL